MSSTEFTPEERALMHSWSGRRHAMGSWLAFYAAILMPMVAFAAYGVVKRDVIAVAIAFGGVLLYQLWSIAHDFSRRETYRSLMTKIAEREAARAAS
jgi:hypothetical protein